MGGVRRPSAVDTGVQAGHVVSDYIARGANPADQYP